MTILNFSNKWIWGMIFLFGHTCLGQGQLRLLIINQSSRLPVAGASATIKGSRIGAFSDSLGYLRIDFLGSGQFEIRITAIGYESKDIKIMATIEKGAIQVELEPSPTFLQDITVTSTRTNSKIKDLPVRVQVLGTEDMEEETVMHPSNVAMLMTEASGIQSQQTSVSSGNIQIKILGLDGKYTQLLKDGFPMYSGFSNGLSIMQIPPLDLKQVELIKGSSSALYGGDAIAGIINFVSQNPIAKPQWNILANQTIRGSTDFGSYFTARNTKWGATLLTTFTHQFPVDIHNNGFTVIPKLTAFTINPKIFWYPEDSVTLSLSLNVNYDNRIGGDLYAVENAPTPEHPYTEANKSNRDYYLFQYQKHYSNQNTLTIRNSFSLFTRDIDIMSYIFSGKELSTFSEINLVFPWAHHHTVLGLNFSTDQFRENKQTDSLLRDYSFGTIGLFAQDDWSFSNRLVVESGLRYDYQNRYGNFILPRLSILFKADKRWSVRLGGGLGYKSATIFDSQTEEIAYRDVLPIGSFVNAERSAGVTASINYSGNVWNDAKLIFDQAFFFTQISNPLQLDTAIGPGSYESYFYFTNAPQPFTTKGFETSIRLLMDEWSVFLGYTHVNALTGQSSVPHIPLSPLDKIVFTLSNEESNSYRLASEVFYTGRQYLSNGLSTPDYWVIGFLAEKVIKKITLILNFEDITDTRQTRFGQVVIPPYTNPSFEELYAPMEGFMLNFAVKFKIL
jgi:iron complex outermembrane receptor protein